MMVDFGQRVERKDLQADMERIGKELIQQDQKFEIP